MPSLLSRLSSLVPAFRPFATPAGSARRRPTPDTDERFPVRSAAALDRVWFLPYADDTSTGDSPEIRSAMRLMLRDPYVKSGWLTQVLGVLSQPFQVHTPKGSHKDKDSQEQADFVRHCLEHAADGMLGIGTAILTNLGSDGFTLSEKVWQIEARGKYANRLTLRALKPKDIDEHGRLVGDRFNNVTGVYNAITGKTFPISDFVYTRYLHTFDEPLGMAAFRPSYGAYWSRDTIRKLRIIHKEKMLDGLLVGSYTDPADKPTLETALARARTSTWLSIPEGVRIEQLAKSQAAESDYKSFDESLREEILVGIALAHLHILQGGVSDARGNTKVHKAVADLGPWLLTYIVQNALNRQVIPDLIDYNYPFTSEYPTVSLGGVENAEILEMLQVLDGAQRAGFKPSRNYYATELTIQEADPADPTDQLAPPPPGGGMGGPGGPGMGGPGMGPEGGDPFGGGGGGGGPSPAPPGGGGLSALMPFAERQAFDSFAWEDWKQGDGGKWTSASGKRTLSDAVYQRLSRRAGKGGGKKAEATDVDGVKFEPDPGSIDRRRYATVVADVGKLDKGWADDKGFYIPAGGGGAEIAGRRAGVEDFLKEGKPVHQPRVALGPDGRPVFNDGRHRFSVLRDKGHGRVPVTVPRGQAAEFERRFGAGANATVSHAPADGDVRQMPPAAIRVDPARFQFKLNVDAESGVGGELKQVKTYNPELAGVIAVWWDPADGQTYVVNGHHRLELAKRTGHPAVAVRHLKAATAEEARAKGALINIAEGRGTAVDAAKFLRDTGRTVADLDAVGVSLKGQVARDAANLAKLDADLFDRVATGRLDPAVGAVIGRHVTHHTDQRQLADFLARREEQTGREVPLRAAEEAAREMAAGPRVKSTQQTLFGPEDDDGSAFLHRAELKSYVRGELAKEARDFRLGASARRAAVLGREGNTLDVAANRRVADRSEAAVDEFDRLVNLKGPLSDLIDQLTTGYANAAGPKERILLRQRAAAAVRDAVQSGEYPAAAKVGGGSPSLFADRGGAVLLFGWDDWQPKGNHMISPGGRVLRRETWERLKSARPDGGGATTSNGPAAPPPRPVPADRHIQARLDRIRGNRAETLKEVEGDVRAAAVELGANPPAKDEVTRLVAANTPGLDPVVQAELGRKLADAAAAGSPEGVRSGWRKLADWAASLPLKAATAAVRGLLWLGKRLLHNTAAALMPPPAITELPGKLARIAPSALKYVGVIALSAGLFAASIAVPVLLPVAWATKLGIAAVTAPVGAAWLTWGMPKTLRHVGREAVARLATHSEGVPQAGEELALAGRDGKRAAELMGRSQKQGREVLAKLTEQAVGRLLADGDPLGATVLFDDDELQQVAASLSATTAAADLLGRSRVRRLAHHHGRRAEGFSEGDGPDGFDVFADAPEMQAPNLAADYFRGLVPDLGVDPLRYAPSLDRHAFTLSVAADQVLLDKVKRILLDQVEAGRRPFAVADIQDELDEAGITARNPQYAEMVYRTNMNDAYMQGFSREMAAPDMREAFPAWQYLGIKDGRQGEDHEPHFDRYYPNTATFAEVRGNRVFNCRCSAAPIHRGEWDRLKRQGIRAEGGW